MSSPIPDEVPEADADTAEAPPLESDESDWREQQLVVEDPEEDFRQV